MALAAQPAGRRPAGRGFVLLVLVLLAGILGMHALTPGPAAAPHPATGHPAAATAATTSASAHAADTAGPGEDCSHTAGGSRHVDHADATCAATGVSSPYAPPPLVSGAVVPCGVPAWVASVPEGGVSGRAPPDLAELQLLRI
ncbi:DUF6153 family protein [Streptomyces sp. NPDC090022]|uniref:DUF6153 family protein n=1 Tax=Streptomyces sp. NPDC090022 TaxID=3365920 RepID=UPI00381B0A49